MRAIVDLDDTICKHENRDYPNAKPIMPVIEKLRLLKEQGWEIIVFSARGQLSCRGQIDLIEDKNRVIAEEWLKKYHVPYDALVFGKPLGDIYIDDKGMSVNDFVDQPFQSLKGGSGKPIMRMGKIVKKEFGTEDEAREYKNWISENKGEYLYPRPISFVKNAVYMDFVDGVIGSDMDAVFLPLLLNAIDKCVNGHPQSFSIERHLERLNLCETSNDAVAKIKNKVALFLKSNSKLVDCGSYCHGDLILSNTIWDGENIWTIDARNTHGANSFLLDLAKLRMSLNGYEKELSISFVDNSKWTHLIDEYAKNLGFFEEVVALELMFIMRCFRYRNPQETDILIKFLEEEGSKWL